jgi:hypothetical protein
MKTGMVMPLCALALVLGVGEGRSDEAGQYGSNPELPAPYRNGGPSATVVLQARLSISLLDFWMRMARPMGGPSG